MSNDFPDKKKGFLSGLGSLLKPKEKETAPVQKELPSPALRPAVQADYSVAPSVPPPQPAPLPNLLNPPNPVTPPVSGRAQHFREEFEVFLSDKQSRDHRKAVAGTAPAPHIPRSGKPQVIKSADLSKEFEFFTKPLKTKNRGATETPVQAVTAKPPLIQIPPQAPIPVPPQQEPVLTPPPPPRIDQKPTLVSGSLQDPESAPSSPRIEPKLPAPPIQTPVQITILPSVTAPALPPAAVPTIKNVEPASSPARVPQVRSAAPADMFAPKQKPLPVVSPTLETVPQSVQHPPLPVPLEKKNEVPPPAPAAAPLVATPSTSPVIQVSPKPASLATEAVFKPGSLSAPTTVVPSAGKKTIKRVELDPQRRKRPAILPPATSESADTSAGNPATAVVLSAAGSGEKKKRSPVLAWVGVGILLILLIGLGIYIYQITRETSAEITFSLEDLSMSGSPLIVYHFDGQVSQIKRDYAERRSPMELRLQEIEADLASAKADLAGREEKKRLLSEEIQKLRDSIPLLVAEGEKKLDRLWKEEGGSLDQSYAAQKESLHKEIENKARELGLKYERNPELDALEVAVNAFRLSLYGAPKTVNVDEQRVFSEDLLKRWRDFEKDWSKKQQEIKEKAMEIKQSPGPRIEDTQKAIESLKVDLEALNIDVDSLQEEVNRRQQDEVEEQEKLREVEKPFLSDLMKVPSNNILRQLQVGSNGKCLLSHLEKSTDMPPGEYVLLVQGQSGEEIFWAFKSVTVTRHKKTEVRVTRQDFKPARKLIQ
jgi:hypothetical protein